MSLMGSSQLLTHSNGKGAKNSKGPYLSLLHQWQNMEGNDSHLEQLYTVLQILPWNILNSWLVHELTSSQWDRLLDWFVGELSDYQQLHIIIYVT